MTTNHHTAISTGAAANASTFNNPLGQLDAQITTNAAAIAANALLAAATTAEVVAARSSYPSLDARLDFMDTVAQLAGGNVATKANGVSAAGQKVLTVDATTGFVVNSPIVYLLNGTTLEGNTIASIQAGVSLTLGTNIGATPAGGVLDDSYISMISISEYLAAQAIPHAGTLMLPQAMEYANSGVFNVRAYGATGDGSTPDHVAIQAAIDAAAASTKTSGVVELPAGRYLIGAALTLPSSVELRGAGADTTELVITSATANGIYSNGTSLIRIRDLMIWSNNVARSAGAAIYLAGCAEVLIENCRIYDSYRPGYFTGCTNMWIEHIRVGHHASQVFFSGFYFVGCIDTHIHNIMVNLGTHVLPYPEALFVFDSNNDTIEMLNSGAGASSGAVCGTIFKNDVVGGFAPRWVRFVNCYYEGGHGDPAYGYNQFGMVINDATNAVFTNCYFASGYGGVDVHAGTDIHFTDSLFLNNATNGAYVTATGGVHFRGCTFDGNSQLATPTYAHLTLGAGVVASIDGNYFGDKIGALLGLTKIAKYAIENFSVGTNIQLGRNTYGTFGTSTFGGSETINGAVPFAAQDATPSVANGALFQTTNGSATVVTMLDDGLPGQIVKILVQDDHTTFDFSGTNLKGNAGVDWVPAAYDWLEAVFDGTNWYCSVHDCTA